MKYFKLLCKKCGKKAQTSHEYEKCEEGVILDDKCMEDWWVLKCKKCNKEERV